VVDTADYSVYNEELSRIENTKREINEINEMIKLYCNTPKKNSKEIVINYGEINKIIANKCEKSNQDVRLMARAAGVSMWKIARALGISEPTLIRKFRSELSEDLKGKIITVIELLK